MFFTQGILKLRILSLDAVKLKCINGLKMEELNSQDNHSMTY